MGRLKRFVVDDPSRANENMDSCRAEYVCKIMNE